MKKKFDINKPFKTECGLEAEFIQDDGSDMPYLVKIVTKTGYSIPMWFCKNGDSGVRGGLKLVNVEEPSFKVGEIIEVRGSYKFKGRILTFHSNGNLVGVKLLVTPKDENFDSCFEPVVWVHMEKCHKIKFDPTKPVQTRDGRKARIICTDRKSIGGYPIVALIHESQSRDFETHGVYTLDGKNYPADDRLNPLDLINID
jgi:hypothetical protein